MWGEVSERLRGVQFRTAANHIDLRFFFDDHPGAGELESIGSVRAEVAADFADVTVAEEAVTTAAESDIPCRDGWHTAYARRAATLAR